MMISSSSSAPVSTYGMTRKKGTGNSEPTKGAFRITNRHTALPCFANLSLGGKDDEMGSCCRHDMEVKRSQAHSDVVLLRELAGPQRSITAEIDRDIFGVSDVISRSEDFDGNRGVWLGVS
jgi:hypothetical protein